MRICKDRSHGWPAGASALFAVLLGVLAQIAHAEAQPAMRATDAGRTLLSGGLGGTWSNDSNDVPWPSLSTWYAYATPGLTYFVRDGVGVGISLGGSFAQRRSRGGNYQYDLNSAAVMAGLSFVLEWRFGTRTSLMALPSVRYVRSSRRIVNVRTRLFGNAPGRNIQSRTIEGLLEKANELESHAMRGSVILPFVVHASDAVLYGFGPEVWVDQLLSGHQANRRDTEVSLGVSTWLGYSF